MKTTKIIVYTRFNYKPDPKNYEVIKGESQTIQGEAFDIKELFLRSSQGLIDSVYRDAQYDDDPQHDDIDMSKIADMDLSEITELKQELLEREIYLKQEEVKKEIKEKQKTQRAEEAKQTKIDEEKEASNDPKND